MNKDDLTPGDEPLFQRIREAETGFINTLEPNPAIKEKLRRRIAAPLPAWKKPVPAWAAAAAVLLFLMPGLFLWINKTGETNVIVQTKTDTLRLRDTLRIVEYRDAVPAPVAVKSTAGNPANHVMVVPQKQLPETQPPGDFELKAALLGVKKLPETFSTGGFTLADDTTYKNFVVTF